MPYGHLSAACYIDWIAQRIGYDALFATATLLCLAFAWLVAAVAPKLRGQEAQAH